MTTEIESKVAAAIAEYMTTSTTKAKVMPKEAWAESEAKPVPPSEEGAAPLEKHIKEKAAVPAKVLADGEVLFSTMFGSVPKNGDFAIPKFAPVPEDAKAFIPKVDEGYIPQTEEIAALVMAFIDGDKTLITGPTGSGKSSGVKFVCAKLGLPFIRINMSGDIESSSVFGQLVVREGSTVWQDGPLTEGVKWGAVVLCDEWELMPPEITMGMQNLLEDDGYLYLKEMPGSSHDRQIVPHANWRIVMAGNTTGQGDDSGGFSGTMVQNTATIDRFSTVICVDYLSKEHEKAIIKAKCPAVTVGTAEKMLQFASLVRTAYNKGAINLTMSPRTLINWGKKMGRISNPREALRVAFLDKLRSSDRRAVDEFVTKVFGK
jgi:cobaltochelatase CobS